MWIDLDTIGNNADSNNNNVKETSLSGASSSTIGIQQNDQENKKMPASFDSFTKAALSIRGYPRCWWRSHDKLPQKTIRLALKVDALWCRVDLCLLYILFHTSCSLPPMVVFLHLWKPLDKVFIVVSHWLSLQWWVLLLLMVFKSTLVGKSDICARSVDYYLKLYCSHWNVNTLDVFGDISSRPFKNL